GAFLHVAHVVPAGGNAIVHFVLIGGVDPVVEGHGVQIHGVVLVDSIPSARSLGTVDPQGTVAVLVAVGEVAVGLLTADLILEVLILGVVADVDNPAAIAHAGGGLGIYII